MTSLTKAVDFGVYSKVYLRHKSGMTKRIR